MADFIFRVNGRELADYVRTAHDEGWDPVDPDAIEPQFSGAPAFAEGAVFTQDAAGNREWQVPLHLKAASPDGLYQLIRDIEGEFDRGVQVELKMPSAANSTFFDLEHGRLDVEWQYWLARASRVRAVLRLWTRTPYGHTGTARTIASFQANGPTSFPATGILGDVDALTKLEVRVGSKVASGGRVVGYGVHRSASFLAYRGPSAADFVAQGGATVRGASGAIGSQLVAIPISPTGASGVALRSYLTPPAGHVGRHRVFGVMRSRFSEAIHIRAHDRSGAPLGPTAVASVTDPNKWGLVDLGEVQVPERDARQEAVPTQYVDLVAAAKPLTIGSGVMFAPQVLASPAFEVNRLIYLPLEEAGLLRTRGAQGDGLLYSDTFQRFDLGVDLAFLPQAEVGGALWKKINGVFWAYDQIGLQVPTWGQPPGSGFYSLASGQLHSDVTAEARVGFSGSSTLALAASSMIEVWLKQLSPTLGVRVKLEFAPSQQLTLVSDTGAGPTVHASAGIASTLASGIYANAGHHRLVVRSIGPQVGVWLATGALSPTPIFTASGAALAGPGWPALRINSGASGRPVVQSFSYSEVSAGGSDMGPREYFRFESHPESRVIQANASVFIADRWGEMRGGPPKLPPVGSPGASGPARVVAFAGDPDDFLGNDVMDVRIDVVERFRFLR